MKHPGIEAVPPDQLLGILAMHFRGTRDEEARAALAESYAQAVRRLIRGGKWHDMPPPEDQLPDDWMPSDFFDYWFKAPTATPGESRGPS